MSSHKLYCIKGILLSFLLCLIISFFYAAPYQPGTPVWNVQSDVVSWTQTHSVEEPVTGFDLILYKDGVEAFTHNIRSLNLNGDGSPTSHEYDLNSKLREAGFGSGYTYTVKINAINGDGNSESELSAPNVKGLNTLGISGLLDFGSGENNIIFASNGNHSVMNYYASTTSYSYALRHEVEAINLEFPAQGQYRLSAAYHRSSTPNDTLIIFNETNVNGNRTIYLQKATNSDGRDANGQPNANTLNNVITIVVNPGNAGFETTYTMILRRRIYCPIASITNISHNGYSFTCTLTGNDNIDPKPSVVNGDTIPTNQSVNWSVKPITGTAYFVGNQMQFLSGGTVRAVAKTTNGVVITGESSDISIAGISDYLPHLAILDLYNGKTGEGPKTITPEFSSDPSKSGDYIYNIIEDFSAIRLLTWAPQDCQLYLNDVRIANDSKLVLRMPPTASGADPNIYTLKVVNERGQKIYNIRIRRELEKRLVYGPRTPPPHLYAGQGDIFGMNNATVKDKFTIQAWVRWTADPSTSDSWANIATLTNNQDSGAFWLQHNQLNSRFEFAFSTVNNRRFTTSVTVPVIGRWYLLTGVYDGAFVNLYVNGNWESRLSNTGNFRFVDSTSEFNIGKMPKINGRRFPGNIRDVRIWVGTARSASDIAADFAGTSINNSNFSWPLNETASGTVTRTTGSVNLTMLNISDTDFVARCQNNTAVGQTMIFRPSRIDVSSASSESAILVHAKDYNSQDSRFLVLGPESSQSSRMQVWDHVNRAWIAPSTISAGVLMDSAFGNPSGSTRYWIPLRLDASTNGLGRYVDDGGTYDGTDLDTSSRTKYNTILPLPPVTAMTGTLFTLSGRLVGTTNHPLTKKYVILGYDKTEKGTLITASSSAITSKDRAAGDFALVSDVPIKRIEVRTQDDVLIRSFANNLGWSSNTSLDNITLPVELSSFTAGISAHGFVQLMWTTQSETNVRGFYMFRSQEMDIENAILVSPLIPGSNTSTTQSYIFTDRELSSSGDYYYWLQSVDLDGSENYFGPVLVSYHPESSHNPDIPLTTEINRIFPNPFNPVVNITYSLKDPAEVSFDIFNQRGQLVKNFTPTHKQSGWHNLRWDGLDNSGKTCSNGVYILRFKAGNTTQTRKLSLFK